MQRMNLALALSVSLALCACNKATGNESAEVVIARVGDDKITLADVQAEQPGIAANAVDAGLVSRLINRKLLAQAAQSEKLDDAATKRSVAISTEIALANAKGKKIADTVPAPTAAEIDAFIAAHPEAFAARRFIVIEQIELARPAEPLAIAPSQTVTSLDQVQSTLDTAGVPYQRTVIVVDTANTPAAVSQRLLAMQTNALFELSTGSVLAEGQIVEVRAVPLSGPRAREIAANFLKNQKIGAAVLKATGDLRKARGDKIKLENGYTEAN